MSATRLHHVRELARGGMGRVDVVATEREGTLELRALKRLLPALHDDPKARRMFLDEAAVASQLDHPNVVRTLQVGEDDEGPFMLMELVDGVSLGTLLAKSRGDLMPVEVALEIVRQAAAGLAAAHALDLVHRDVSPANLLLGFDGVVRVADFGIAKGPESSTHTTTNVLKGKLGYLAPEQLRFEPADPRTDLYALGVCLFEALVGQRMHAGDSAAVARAITDEPPPDAGEHRRDLPPELAALLFDLLAKERAGRPADAGALVSRLETLPASEPADLAAHLSEALPEEAGRHQRWLQDASRIVAAAAEAPAPAPTRPALRWAPLLVLLTLVGAALALVFWRAPSSAPTAPETIVVPPLAQPTRGDAAEPPPATERSAAEEPAEAAPPRARRRARPPARRRTMRAAAMSAMAPAAAVDTWSWDE